jgi:Golgi complex component 7 (COG7)
MLLYCCFITASQSSLVTLREAANWESLVRTAEARFTEGDLVSVTEVWEGLRRSLIVLQNMPEAAEREATLAAVRHKLETALRPKLLAALQQQQQSSVHYRKSSGVIGHSSSTGSDGSSTSSNVSLQQFIDIYQRLGQLDALKDEYTKAKPAAVHKLWYAQR